MMLRKLTKPLVLLLATILIVTFWWHGSFNDRADLTEFAANAVSTTQQPPAKTARPQAVVDDPGSPVVIADGDLPETVTIRGQLKDRQEQGASGMQVELSSKGMVSSMHEVYAATTDVEGNFEIESVPLDKDYRLEVLASGIYAGTLVDPFPVNRNMAPVPIVLDSLEVASLEGLFVDSDFGPVAGFEMLVQNAGIAYPGRKIKSDSSGFFQLGQFPAGDLQLSASGKESFRVTGIELKAGEYRNLEVVVDKGNYHLSGWVVTEFDEPLAQARVVLTSDYVHPGYRSTSYRLVLTDLNGNFEFANIGGMQHRILVDAVGYQSQSFDHRFQMLSDHLTIRMPSS